MIESGNPDLSIKRQCKPLSVSCSLVYYRPQPRSQQDLDLRRVIDE